MARWISLMAVFFISVNLFSALVMSTGVGAALNLQIDVGGDDKVSEAQDQAGNISTGAPTGQTLFGMYNVLAGGLSVLTAPITAGPQMLARAGVPDAITNRLLQPLIAITYALGIISFLRGWGL